MVYSIKGSILKTSVHQLNISQFDQAMYIVNLKLALEPLNHETGLFVHEPVHCFNIEKRLEAGCEGIQLVFL